MELEARSAAPTSAARGRALTAKVAAYRADAAALAKRAREAAKAAASSSGNAGGGDLARAELGLGGGASSSGFAGGGGGAGRAGGGGGFSSSNNSDRDRVLAAGERIERSGERIAQGRAQLLQTEVSVSFFRDLFSFLRVWESFEESALAHERCFFQKKKKKKRKALGASILESLAAQRAAIERSRERLAETDGYLAAGSRALKRMGAWFPWLGRQD